MRINPSPIPPVNEFGPDERLSGSTHLQHGDAEQAAADSLPDTRGKPRRSPIIAGDARAKKALADETTQQRSKRSIDIGLDRSGTFQMTAEGLKSRTPNEGPSATGQTSRADVADDLVNVEAIVPPVQGSNVTGSDQIKRITVAKDSPHWDKLHQIHTATQALLLEASSRYREQGLAVAEGFIERLLDATSERAQLLSPEVSRVLDRDMQPMLEAAALLYRAGVVVRERTGGEPLPPRITALEVIEAGLLNEFKAAIEREELRRSMFNRPSLPERELRGRIYFDGNALVNAAGKSVSQLAQEPSLMSIPAYARLSSADRLSLLKKWLDERGLDHQYAFGTVENAMASVLKASAIARGERPTDRYATETDLHLAFNAHMGNWQQADGSLIDPRVHFGLNLAKTRGISIAGDTPEKRLDDLRSLINDVLTELGGPPRYDRRTVALESLMTESGLSEADLTRPLRGRGNSILDTFLELYLDRPEHVRCKDIVVADNGAWVSFQHAASLVEAARSKFRDPDSPDKTRYFTALARLRVRMEWVPLTDAAVAVKRLEIEKEIDAAYLDYVRGIVTNDMSRMIKAARAIESKTGTRVMKWLEATPIVSNAIGLSEGLMTGNVEQIINSVPLYSNLYNIAEGLRTEDYKRAGMAAISLVPYLGPAAEIIDGVVSDDPDAVAAGVQGLAFDAIIPGSAQLKTKGGRLRSVHAYSKMGKTGQKSLTIPFEAMPRALQMHTQTLAALKDLGFADNAKALKITSATGVGKATPKPAATVAAIPSHDAARLTKQFEGYEVRTRPTMLRPNASGMLWDPATAAHYAEFEGKTYRLAPDPAKTTLQRPIWNVVSPDGSNRVMTVPLEYVFDGLANEGAWRATKDFPGLRGGIGDADVDTASVVSGYWENQGNLNRDLGRRARELVSEIEELNRAKQLELTRDVEELSSSFQKMKQASDKLNPKLGLDEGQLQEAKGQFARATRDFIEKLGPAGEKINAKLRDVTRIQREVKSVTDTVQGGETANGKIMRLMSEAEAKEIKDSRMLKQRAGASFEQHKWFYIDQSKLPIQGKSSPYRLEIDVPKSLTDRIFAVASDDPNGTLEPFRQKPGPTNEHPDAPPREEGAFGVQKYGLSEFSRLLEKFKWRIVDTKDPAKIFAHKDQPSPRGADSPRVPPR